MADSNKTEPGTAHKREEARKEGQIARSHDLPGAAAILTAIAVLAWFSSGGVAQWGHLMGELLEQASLPDRTIGLAQFRASFLLAFEWTALVTAAAWVVCTAVAFQGGINFSAKALLKWERLRPDQNLKNMFSASSWSRTARSILPVLVIAWFTYGLLSSNWSLLAQSSYMTIPGALAWMAQLLLSLAWRGGAVLLVWSGVDYVLQRYQHEHSLRMSKQEVKDEGKELQGNPETRGRIKRIQRQMHRRRMMHQIATATVVITNPTHYAVALRYDADTMAAPVVVAKGSNLVALRIRARAVSAGVPIIENRAVARALYRHVEIGAPIPGTLYAAVAEILAFIRRAQARRTAMPALNF